MLRSVHNWPCFWSNLFCIGRAFSLGFLRSDSQREGLCNGMFIVMIGPVVALSVVFWSCQTNLNVCVEEFSVLNGLKERCHYAMSKCSVEGGGGGGASPLATFLWMVASHFSAKRHKRRSMRRIASNLFAQSVSFILNNTKEGLSLRLCWCWIDIMAFQISDLLWSVQSIAYTAAEDIFVCIKFPTPGSASFHTL